jgi:hypothetical protein
VKLYPHSTNTHSWRGAWLSTRKTLTSLPFTIVVVIVVVVFIIVIIIIVIAQSV